MKPHILFLPECVGDATLSKVTIPQDLDSVLDEAWKETQAIPGHLGEAEARFLGLLAASVPAEGSIVEIGSFKGRSTVMLAKVASHYGSTPVVAIDPHNSPILLNHAVNPAASSYPDFLASIKKAGVSQFVEPHMAYSSALASSWSRPIRMLWIDGDHTYEGAKQDLDGFLPHLVPFGVVAIHDALNVFPGPIRIFVEEILRSDQFGPAGFVSSIAWAQYRPNDGHKFKQQRRALEQAASRLIPFVQSGEELRGFTKRRFKFNRFRVPHGAVEPRVWASLLNFGQN
jgi:MMP 1-O-methyltransferase